MRAWLSGFVALLGVVVTFAGCVALYNYGIVADENGISGSNPALWIILMAGILTAVTGAVLFVQSMGARGIPSPSR